MYLGRRSRSAKRRLITFDFLCFTLFKIFYWLVIFQKTFVLTSRSLCHWGSPEIVCRISKCVNDPHIVSVFILACILSRGTFRASLPTTLRWTSFSTSTSASRRQICQTFTSSVYRKSMPIRKTLCQIFSKPIHGSKRWRICWSRLSISSQRPNKCKDFSWRFSLSGNICTTFARSKANIRKLAWWECG